MAFRRVRLPGRRQPGSTVFTMSTNRPGYLDAVLCSLLQARSTDYRTTVLVIFKTQKAA